VSTELWPVQAQEFVEAESEYANRAGKAQQLGKLDAGAFGEKEK